MTRLSFANSVHIRTRQVGTLRNGAVNIQDGYKSYERLHKFIGKKVIATQKLNTHPYACVQRNFLCCILGWFEFNFCVFITFLPTNLCNPSHHL
jgi:hypothetical protein